MKLKNRIAALSAAALLLMTAGCAAQEPTPTEPTETPPTSLSEEQPVDEATDVVDIVLSDDGVTCDAASVYTANDIIYYEDGHDDTYGEGDEADAHTAEEAAAHTVVHITEPGTYRVTGKLSAGQLFVDLGEEAETDPNARVTLILDGVDITCTVAPGVFFYRVYECCDAEEVTLTPDLTNAGAVVELADGSENVVNGAYVARIYKEGTTKKLHKYDGAFYSKMSLRIEGDTGSLTVNAENEGLDSELHLTLNGGNITIVAQDDGINTNEDGISVTTLNGGTLTVTGGLGDEGDGIDSNGALVINGGTLYATANPRTGDGGIDADTGIYLNGGTVVATGSRNDEIESDSTQQYMELTFAQTVAEGSEIVLLQGDETVFCFTAARDFSSLSISTAELATDVDYTLTVNGVVQQHGGAGGMLGGMQRPGLPSDLPLESDPSDGDAQIPEPPGGMDAPVEKPAGLPDGATPDGTMPEGEEPPEKPDGTMPDGAEPPEKPDGDASGMPDGDPNGNPQDPAQNVPFGTATTEVSQTFTLTAENHTFYNVRNAE